MWTDEEHRVFLKYCEDLRLACFHAMAKDTGARPSELLALKISDLQIQTSRSTGKRYAQFTIGRTVPSFRIVIAQEKKEWKPFREGLDKSEKKEFDEMWDIPRLYVSA